MRHDCFSNDDGRAVTIFQVEVALGTTSNDLEPTTRTGVGSSLHLNLPMDFRTRVSFRQPRDFLHIALGPYLEYHGMVR